MVNKNTLPALELSFRPDLNILFCRWMQPSSSEALQHNYLQALEKAKELQVHYWLFDLRRRGPATSGDEAWLLKTFFPQVEATIPGKHYFAYLVTPSHYLHIQEGVGMATIQQYSIYTRIFVFDSESKAINWLTSSR